MQHVVQQALAALLICAAGTAAAQTANNKRIVAAPGADVVAAKCGICHDLSHITRSRLSQGEWEDNLVMMVKRGMVITPDENRVALDYLTRHYGPNGPAANVPLFGASLSASSGAADVQQLLAANACTGCHAVDQRVVGPSFKEVAMRYANQPEHAAQLVKKLREGGAGVWGQTPMPPMPQLSTADADALIRYVLSLK